MNQNQPKRKLKRQDRKNVPDFSVYRMNKIKKANSD